MKNILLADGRGVVMFSFWFPFNPSPNSCGDSQRREHPVAHGSIPTQYPVRCASRRGDAGTDGRPLQHLVLAAPLAVSRSSSREVRIRVALFFSLVYFSMGTLPPKRVKGALLEDPGLFWSPV